MYEWFEHTADLGLRIQAESLDLLFRDAAECLVATFLENPQTIQPKQVFQFEIVGDDLSLLLFDWLKEILLKFDCDGMLLGFFEVSIHEGQINAIAKGEPIDRKRHTLSREVKAITYHDLTVEKTVSGWLAEVIVDI